MNNIKPQDCLVLLETAWRNKEWDKLRYYDKFLLKRVKLHLLSPIQNININSWIGNAYYNLRDYSRSLDAYYKASMLGLKHAVEPSHAVHPSVMMGSNFMLLREINQAMHQFEKAKQYFAKYGTNTPPMDKNSYYTTMMGLGYCYIFMNELEKTREIIDIDLVDFEDGVANNRYFPLNYYHLKGEYLVAMKDNDGARQAFVRSISFAEKENLPPAVLEARFHLAVIELLEGSPKHAISILKGNIKDAKRIHLHEMVGESSLLLSKCYSLINMPDKALAIERSIKPILNKIDMDWLYERSREYEHLYNKLQPVRKHVGISALPAVLAYSINMREGSSHFKDIVIGNSQTMQDIYQFVDKIAPTDMPVLIQGETGTGKELIARALHNNSQRSNKTLMALNCGALPDSLLESELFGHVKGAFTGASGNKKGYIEVASEGTLFLDEIADMSMKMQQRLLRALEEKQIWRVGDERPIPINTRFVFASNQNVELMISKKLFREDLFYRINTIVINLPPLRDRRDDIPLLADHFLAKYSAEGPAVRISKEALAAMMNYSWPGNIRELENEIKRICVLHRGSAVIVESMLSEAVRMLTSGQESCYDGSLGLIEMRANFEREVIMKTLLKCQGNISETARLLKYNRSELYKKMRTLQIDKSVP